MDAFIAEVLDEYSVDLNTDPTFASFIEDGVLQYRKLTSDPRVLRNLVFCWTWRRILGVWPSKIHVIGAVGDGFEAAMERIAECTLFFGGMDKERGRVFGELTGYLEALKNQAFVKAELIDKLRDRLNPGWTGEVEGKTLFRIYGELVGEGGAGPYVNFDWQPLPNPLTGFLVELGMGQGPVRISRYDLAKAVYAADYYFCRLLAGGTVAVFFEEPPAYPKGIGAGLALGVGAGVLGVCANAFVCRRQDLVHSATCVPRFAPQCLVWGGCLKGFSKNVQELEVDKSLDADCFELLCGAEMGRGSVPVGILRCMVELHKLLENSEKGFFKSPKRGGPPDFCVVLIDNRPNMLSVLSTKITLANLKPGMWDLVVFTSAAATDFYRRHLPSANVLKHPMLEGLFNIETYNRLMKDSTIWEALVAYKKCLLVQDDGMLIRPGVEDLFFDYDYVGAPWPPGSHLVAAGVGKDFIGNGGLSVRDVGAMLEITRTCLDEKMRLFNSAMQPVPEDVYFSAALEKRGGHFPSRALAQRFAMEMSLPPADQPAPLGFHKPWPYVGVAAAEAFLRARINELKAEKS
jgi:hypothetical protein